MFSKTVGTLRVISHTSLHLQQLLSNLFRSELALNRVCKKSAAGLKKSKRRRSSHGGDGFNRFYNENATDSVLEEYAMEERDRPRHVRRVNRFRGVGIRCNQFGNFSDKLRRSLA